MIIRLKLLSQHIMIDWLDLPVSNSLALVLNSYLLQQSSLGLGSLLKRRVCVEGDVHALFEK